MPDAGTIHRVRTWLDHEVVGRVRIVVPLLTFGIAKFVLLLFGVLALWDTIAGRIQQALSSKWEITVPTVADAVEQVGLPWWSWITALTILLLGIVLEASYREILSSRAGGKKTPVAKPVPIEVPHDTVNWREIFSPSRRYHLYVSGPLCPTDGTGLFVVDERTGHRENAASASEYVVVGSSHQNDYINKGESHLACPKCSEKYWLGNGPKEVRASRDEANEIIKAKRSQMV